MRHIYAIALVLVCASFAPPRAPEKLKVFLLVGQSNMQGKGKLEHLRALATDAATKADYGHLVDEDGEWKPRDDVWIWYMGRTGALDAGFGTPEDRFGPELQLGHVLGNALDEKVLLIKIAWGGKSLAVDFRPPSAGGERGAFYVEMFAHARDVLEHLDTRFPQLAGLEPELAGFVWFQGWNDRVNQAFNDEYAQNLAHLIRDVRAELELPELPFVIGETGQGGPGETHPRALSLMRAQADVARATEFARTVRLARTTHCYASEPSHDGGYHFFGTAANFIGIGQSLGDALLELLKPRKR
jgi:alpha-galactosidase